MFADLSYRTKKTWSREGRVIAKAERLAQRANPQLVVTSLTATECDACTLYEDRYCARGNMENRIKEQRVLFADHTSCHTIRANQLRLLFSTVADVLLRRWLNEATPPEMRFRWSYIPSGCAGCLARFPVVRLRRSPANG